MKIIRDTIEGAAIGILVCIVAVLLLLISSAEFQQDFRCDVLGTKTACFSRAVDRELNNILSQLP